MVKSREIFHFNPPIQTKEDWVLELVDLEVYNSIFNITTDNNKFTLYKYPDDKIGGIAYEKVRDEIERDLGITEITPIDLQDDIIAPFIIEEYKEQVAKRMEDGAYMNNLTGYVSSVFQNFESYLRTEVGLVEDDIKLVLDEYNSSFITYKLDPGIYTFKDISEALFNILQSEYPGPSNVIFIEFDDIARKTKLIVRDGIIAISFTPGWDYKHCNEYISQKRVHLGNTNKIHLKCVCNDVSVVNGIREPILFSFVLSKPAGYKMFCEPETIHYKKINKAVLNTINFYLEDDNNEEVGFNGETMTFRLQMVKI